MGKVQRKFSHTFNGKVWNLTIPSDKDLLLVEVRKHDQFITQYYLLNIQSGEFILSEIELDEKWWIGVTLFKDDLILFHAFPDQENPEVKDLYAFDVNTKNIRWTLTNRNVIGFDGDRVATMPANDDPEKLIEYIDLSSGKPLEEVDNEIANPENKNLQETFHYRQGTSHFETVNHFIKQTTEREMVIATDYYENRMVIIISYYYRLDNKKLANNLLVVDHEGEILLEETLGNELNGISSETFFVFGNKLIFVKDTTTLMIYQLPQ